MFKNILNVAFIVLMAASFKNSAIASWMCEGSCDTSCFRGTLSRSGATEWQARSAMKDGCIESANNYNCYESPAPIINRCYEQGGGVPSTPRPTSYKLVLKNNCSKHGKIWSAIHFRDLAGNWQTKGYWGLEFGQTAYVGDTTNRVFFTHGHNDANITWGDGYAKLVVRGEEKSFGKREIEANTKFGPYTAAFTCN
ncbi:MAG: hypothetical protein NT027_14710 [Proteobacteria bacterium]|nr:hypothetical protein [Pseudomonadota bacterium]